MSKTLNQNKTSWGWALPSSVQVGASLASPSELMALLAKRKHYFSGEVRAMPCRGKERAFPQHFELCGEDTEGCIVHG